MLVVGPAKFQLREILSGRPLGDDVADHRFLSAASGGAIGASDLDGANGDAAPLS